MGRERFQRGWLRIVGRRVKKWRGEWFAYIIENGQERRKHRSAILGLVPRHASALKLGEITRADAHKKLAERIEQETRQTPKPDDGLALREFVLDVFLPMKTPAWEQNTIASHGNAIKRYLLADLGHLPLRDLARPILQKHLNDLAARGYSSAVLARSKTYLRAILEEAVELGYLSRNPATHLQLPKSRRKPCTRFLAGDEARRLLSHLMGRDHLIFRLFLLCGLRPGEVFALKDDDIGDGWLRIDEATVRNQLKSPKTGRARFVPLPQSLQVEIEGWRERQGLGLLFPGKTGKPMWSLSYYANTLKPLGKKLNIPGLTFQALRRTFSTLIKPFAEIRDISAMLGHSSPATSLGHYIQPVAASQREAVERLDGVLYTIEHESAERQRLIQ